MWKTISAPLSSDAPTRTSCDCPPQLVGNKGLPWGPVSRASRSLSKHTKSPHGSASPVVCTFRTNQRVRLGRASDIFIASPNQGVPVTELSKGAQCVRHGPKWPHMSTRFCDEKEIQFVLSGGNCERSEHAFLHLFVRIEIFESC